MDVTQVRHQITERHTAVAKYLYSNSGQSPLIRDMKKIAPAKNITGILTELETNTDGGEKLRTSQFIDKKSDLRKIISPNSPDLVVVDFTEYDIYGDFEHSVSGKSTKSRNSERLIRHNPTGRIFATLDHYQGFEEIVFR